jgi:hypothetical protein
MKGGDLLRAPQRGHGRGVFGKVRLGVFEHSVERRATKVAT